MLVTLIRLLLEYLPMNNKYTREMKVRVRIDLEVDLSVVVAIEIDNER